MFRSPPLSAADHAGDGRAETCDSGDLDHSLSARTRDHFSREDFAENLRGYCEKMAVTAQE
jgi:hypothetical protein